MSPRWRPALTLLVVAPFLGEGLSTSTGLLGLLNPLTLGLFVALYGCGALLCREATRRLGLGRLGLGLLAAAYAVYEEALVDGYWFDTHYWHTTGVDGYASVWHTNLLLAAHLTAFHVAVSITASIVVVERLFPHRRDEPWAGRTGLVVAGLALLVLVPFLYGEAYHGPRGPVGVAVGLVVVLVAAALLVPRPTPGVLRRPWAHPRTAGLVAGLCAGVHFVLVYTVRHTGLPWPLGLALAMSPVVLGLGLVARRPRDGLPVVTGLLGFFVLLDLAIGAFGQYDLVLGGLATAFALWRLNRSAPGGRGSTAAPSVPSAAS